MLAATDPVDQQQRGQGVQAVAETGVLHQDHGVATGEVGTGSRSGRHLFPGRREIGAFPRPDLLQSPESSFEHRARHTAEVVKAVADELVDERRSVGHGLAPDGCGAQCRADLGDRGDARVERGSRS